MADLGKILEGIATLLWPIITIILIVVLIVLFRPAIAAIIESAKSRKFTLKIGGQELTMDEVSKQQRDVITDIQTQISELRHKIEGDAQLTTTLSEPSSGRRLGRSLAILWVDDNPKNNSYYVQQLSDMNLKVDLALSTSEGLRQFNEGQYTLVISDMGRQEKGSFNHTAGFDLLKEIRASNPDIPFIIFTTSSAVRKHASQAKELGVTLITSSGTAIMGILLSESVKDSSISSS